MISELTTLLQERKKDFLTICTSPFDFEGRKRKAIANSIQLEFKSVPNFKCYDLDLIVEKYGGSIPINRAFEKGDEELYMIYRNKI